MVMGAITGMAVGTVSYMMMQSKAKKPAKEAKKKAAKAMRTVGNVFESISYMM